MNVVTADGGPAPAGLLEAFTAYETALMADDLAAMDELFAPGEATMRADGDGVLIGHESISQFRRIRRGAPQRTVGDVHVRSLDEVTALVVAITHAVRGRGVQTQVWRHESGRWQVLAAHVGAPPSTVDTTVWRTVGAPLMAGSGTGPLVGETLAVKDVFAVAGHSTGAGVPELERGRPAQESAAAVALLTAAGADVAGIARTDQLAYSIAGTNEHYGTPANPAVTGAIPGGSSSGSATAVSRGAATIGLGTDTAGSIRVPASYQGLWGLRTTHGSVPAAGLVPLAPDFDTVGLLTRDAARLVRAAQVLVPAATAPVGDLVTDPGLVEVLDPGVAQAWQPVAAGLTRVSLPPLATMYDAFRVHQAFQAWQRHGAFLRANPGAVVGSAAKRFEIASRITDEQDARARAALEELRGTLQDLLGDAVLVLPSASSVAPSLTADAARLDRVRVATLQLTCVAGITGRPAVSMPGLAVGGAPVGVCLVGPRGSDRQLVQQAAELPIPAGVSSRDPAHRVSP